MVRAYSHVRPFAGNLHQDSLLGPVLAMVPQPPTLLQQVWAQRQDWCSWIAKQRRQLFLLLEPLPPCHHTQRYDFPVNVMHHMLSDHIETVAEAYSI